MSSKNGPVMAALAAVFGLACCGSTRVHGLETDESFTHLAAIEGGLAVAGVTSSLGGLPEADRSRFARALKREIDDARGEYAVFSAERVSTRLGPARHQELLDEYRDTGSVQLERLEEAGSVLEARYLIFARIEVDRIERDRSKRTDEEEEEATFASKTSRDVTVVLQVYDLDRRQVVWRGDVETSDSNVTESTDGTWSGLVGDDVGGWLDAFDDDDENYPGYPQPPSMASMLRSVFQRFAEKLPGG